MEVVHVPLLPDYVIKVQRTFNQPDKGLFAFPTMCQSSVTLEGPLWPVLRRGWEGCVAIVAAVVGKLKWLWKENLNMCWDRL